MGKEKERISLREVRHVATLARLAPSAEEERALRDDLDRILSYVEQLQAVDVEQVPPTMHALDLRAPWRDDVVHGELPQALALREAPLAEDGAFAVPKVLDVEK